MAGGAGSSCGSKGPTPPPSTRTSSSTTAWFWWPRTMMGRWSVGAGCDRWRSVAGCSRSTACATESGRSQTALGAAEVVANPLVRVVLDDPRLGDEHHFLGNIGG